MGRPLKPPEERKTEVLYIRLTTAQADALYRLAIRLRRPAATLVRDAVDMLVQQRVSVVQT